MHVVICSEYFGVDAGATGKVLAGLANALLERDPSLRISVVTSDRGHRSDARMAPPQASRPDRMNVVRFAMPRMNRDSKPLRLAGDALFSTLVATRLSLAKFTPDVVLVVTNPFVLPGAIAAYRLARGVPYVYLVHDLYPDMLVALGELHESSVTVRLLRYLQRSWLHRAGSVIAIGRCMRDRLASTYGVPEDKIVVVPNWSEVECVAPSSFDTAFRRTHRLEGFVVLYSGNIGRFHDVDTVLDAAAMMQVTDPSVTFAFVGTGGGRSRVLARVDRDKLKNVRVFELVPEHDLADLLASANAITVTLAAETEGLAVPLKLYNALAAGRPVLAVTSPRSEVARTLKDHGCGLHVENGDAVDMVAAIRRLADDPDLALEMGQRSRVAAERVFSLDRAAQAYAHTLALVAGGRRAPA